MRRHGSIGPIRRAYTLLHQTGHAHSVEAWQGDELVGGLYGVTLGAAFFGESMFSRVRDASKICLVHLVERLRERGFRLLDTQFTTEHLKRFGAIDIDRMRYEEMLADALAHRAAFDDLSKRVYCLAVSVGASRSAAPPAVPVFVFAGRLFCLRVGRRHIGVLLAALQPDVVDGMFDRVQARAFSEHPAGEDAADFPVEGHFVDLDEAVGLRLQALGTADADARGDEQRAELHRLIDIDVESDGYGR